MLKVNCRWDLEYQPRPLIGERTKMRSRPNPLFALLNQDYYETFNIYTPQRADFHDPVVSRMPPGWQISRNGIWFYCNSERNVVPLQGWKIHISATLKHAHETLDRVTSALFWYGKANFKFALDLSTLFMLNSKNWARAGSGKFITIYPADSNEFLELIEELHQATAGLQGPYILSDRRYQESGVVFYRYGGMQPNHVLDIHGEKMPVLLAPSGEKVPDQRLPYPVTPDWVSQPLPLLQETAGPQTGLHDGRYLVQDVLGFSNAGGVYKGRDSLTGRQVVIKEARPGVNATSDGYDAVSLLKKEYRLLELLADAEIAPRPVELFQEWEHWFLVEDFIEGVSLASHSASQNILLRTRPAARDYEEWYKTFCALAASLARIMDVLHSRGIVFGDLSTTNLIVTEGNALKLIDFEGAFELATDPPTAICTPGFVSSQRLLGMGSGFADDYYAMGAVLLAYLLPLTPLFHLNPEVRRRVIQSIRHDMHLPAKIAAILMDLLSHDPALRPAPLQVLEAIESSRYSPVRKMPAESENLSLPCVVRKIATHIHESATYKRKDRLFPSNPKMFITNPLSLAYGASGVAYALQRITGQVPRSALDWILSHNITAADYTPGLYLGLSGIALALLELGAQQPAESILRLSSEHSLLHASPDLFYGIAGWGMANLKFFLQTKNEFYLRNAVHAGNHLLQISLHTAAGRYWQNLNEVRVGYAHGASGISLFLLYLYLATGDECFLLAGQQGLEFDLSQACPTKDGGLSWPDTAGSKSPLYPYWRTGSAGIGIALLRFYRLMGTDRYRSILEKIFIDVDRKYAVSPGLFSGMAGLGEFLLDMYEFSGERKYCESAHTVAKGIMHFRVERNGIAFPGESLDRLCCDMGTGSAGVALFLSRLLDGTSGAFMLDSLFTSKMAEVRSPAAA